MICKILGPYTKIADYPLQYLRYYLKIPKTLPYYSVFSVHQLLNDKWVITHHNPNCWKKFDTFEDVSKALDEELILDGFKLLNEEEFNKYQVLL